MKVANRDLRGAYSNEQGYSHSSIGGYEEQTCRRSHANKHACTPGFVARQRGGGCVATRAVQPLGSVAHDSQAMVPPCTPYHQAGKQDYTAQKRRESELRL